MNSGFSDDIGDLDRQIAGNVQEFRKEFKWRELRRRRLGAEEREQMLNDTLGPKSKPVEGETFAVGDTAAGVTSVSIWFEHRRVHFATVISIAVGELSRPDETLYYCIDINCTVNRSYRISVTTVPESDAFLVALSQFMSFQIVPTVEDRIQEERREEEAAAAREANDEQRQRRMELLAVSQQQLLEELIQVECAPRTYFGMALPDF